MMAALWSDVEEDLASSLRHFAQAVRIFRDCRFDGDPSEDYILVSAFMHAMQSGYSSFEASLKRIFSILDEPLPVGSDWHGVLLRRARRPLETSRPEILSGALYEAADELRRFRHVAMHLYERLDREKASKAAEAAGAFLAEVGPAMSRFRAIIDPD